MDIKEQLTVKKAGEDIKSKVGKLKKIAKACKTQFLETENEMH